MRRMALACVVSAFAGLAFAGEAAEEGFVPLFNGKDLTGWEGDAKLWVVEDGLLIGRSPGIPQNDFLATMKSYKDFILRFQVKLVGNKGNSGMQFRSKRVPPPSHEVSGYQADMAVGMWGNLYDESRRNRNVARPKPETVERALKPTDWNDYEVVAIGNKITMAINGVEMVNYVEEDEKLPQEGIFATQIHSGVPMEVQFKNIRLKELNKE